MTQESQSSTKAAPQDVRAGIAEPMPQDVRAGGIKPTPQDARAAQELLDFIGECPSMFHTASTIGKRLTTAGFTYLPETQPWNIEQGGTYYTTRNSSSVIAFKVGTSLDNYHSRSPHRMVTRPPSKSSQTPSSQGRANRSDSMWRCTAAPSITRGSIGPSELRAA